MSEVDLSLALGEVAAVCKAVPSARVWLASCDTEATFHGSATGISRVELRGGGGTSLEAALEVMDTHRINPSAVVFLTDGFTTWSKERPPALNGKAALVVSPASSPDAPDWAVHIRCL